jgi:CrcB protein
VASTLFARAAHAAEATLHSGRAGQLLYVAAGACLGALARYFLQSAYNALWPNGTLTANLIGCFLAGALSPFFTMWPAGARLFLLTGFLGALTTLSSFSLEAVLLFQKQHVGMAARYLLSTVGGGVLACATGAWLSSTFILR